MFSVEGHKLPAWLITVIILFGIFVIILCANKSCNYQKIRDGGCKTQGVITKKENFLVEYDYIINGQTYHGRQKGRTYDVSSGDMFTTYYDCHDKSKSFIALDEKVIE